MHALVLGVPAVPAVPAVPVAPEIALTESNRFSRFVDDHDLEGILLLKKWITWFEKDGIRCRLASTTSKNNRIVWAVYREGLRNDWQKDLVPLRRKS